MAILSELREAVDAFAARSALDVERHELLGAVRELSGDDLIDLAARAYAVIHTAQCVATVAAAVIAERSTRERGHGGLAAVKGHKTARDLVQAISGGTKADAARTVRLGESLLDGEPAGDAGVGARPAVVTPWHDPLRRAMLSGGLTAAQHDAIYRGLGEPPAAESSAVDSILLREAWTLAATQLIAEAAHLSVEELIRRARQVRDALDPAGLEERFARRYEARSFVRWTDAEGGRHARIDFDDDGGELIEAIIAAALRPRRGGPRFVAEDERRAADDLVADPRTNDQLTYDLMIGVLRAGALADAADVFGARQPGVRMIVVKDAGGPRDPFGRLIAAGNVEDGGNAIPGSMIERAICESGTVQITVDSCGNPLDVGREQRLFSPRQRIALAARDGGCRWPGCDVPASYCEAHHCDEWSADHGRTDIDRGILLCRHHHMMLHNNGWRIAREGKGEFMLHPPGSGAAGQEIRVMATRSAVRWAWDPPPKRASWRERPAA